MNNLLINNTNFKNSINLLILIDYIESSTKLVDSLSNTWMLAFCSLTWWRKPENPEKTINLRWATTTLPHAYAENGKSW